MKRKWRVNVLKLFVVFCFAGVYSVFFSFTVWAENFSAGAENVILEDGGYLSDTEYTDIINRMQEFFNTTGYAIGITIADDIGEKTPEQFADDSFDNTFGISANGVWILINNDTLEDWFSTCGTAIAMYTDQRISAIHQSAKQFLIDERYYDALKMYLQSCLKYYDKGVPSSANSLYSEENTGSYSESEFKITGGMVLFGVFGGFFVALGWVFYIKKRYQFQGTPSAHTYLDQNHMKMLDHSDIFLRKHVHRTKIQRDPPSSGGGGHSSVHTSSGGGTHGGGGSRR